MSKEIKIHDLEFIPFITKKEIQNRVKEIGKELKEKYGDEVPVFMGMLSGAFIFIADIIRAFKADCEVSFVKYHSYKGTKSTGNLNEVLGVDDSIKGRVVILVEDIIDSGNTMMHFLPLIKAKNPKHVEVVSLLFKPTAVEHHVNIDHIGFEIEDKFVVGYGLDYNGVGRNLKAIYQVKG
jgi:hypoxanthine phosphoribosyltransferase